MADEHGTTGGETSRTEKVKEKAREVKDRAETKAGSMASEVHDRGEEAVREGKAKAKELKHEAQVKARSRAEEQKDRVAGGIRTVAEALRNGSDSLPEDRRQYSGFLETVADRVDGVSRYLEQHDVDGLTREARRFAREQTPLFLGGAFALGMAGARFLKSSGSEAVAGRIQDGGDRGYAGEPEAVAPARREYGREPARPYPRSSTVRDAAERTSEEGGYA